MSLDSLQKTFENDTHPVPTRKKTRILFRSQTASHSQDFPVSSFRLREHSTARSLDTLCGPECSENERQGHLATRYRAATLENLPTATQSDNEYCWNTQHREETFENLSQGGHRPDDRYSSSRRSPLVIEMAREIEHLKSELEAFQRLANGNGYNNVEQSGGMTENGNMMEEKDKSDIFTDHTSTPLKTDNEINPPSLIQRASIVSPSLDKRIGKQDNISNHANNTVDGPDGSGMWYDGAGFEQDRQKLNVNELPLVLELRAQVAQLQAQLRSTTVNCVNPPEDAAFSTSLLQKNSASGNVSNESGAVAHLRRVIQVRNTALIVLIVS